MDTIHDLMVKWSTPRRAVVAYVAAVVSLVVYLSVVAELDAMIGWGGKLDLRPGGYDLADVNALLADLGTDGRSLYVRTTVGDTIWPLLAGVSGFLAAPLAARGRRTVVALGLLPMAFGLIDLVENSGLLAILGSYPDVAGPLVTATSVVTQIKLLVILPPAIVAWFGLPFLVLARRLGSRRLDLGAESGRHDEALAPS